MTKKELNNQLKVYNNYYCSDTCKYLNYEIIKKIVNCKNLNEIAKLSLIEQYQKDQITNGDIISILKEYNK